MSQDNAAIMVPIRGMEVEVEVPDLGLSSEDRIWESDWFIMKANGCYVFTHNLNFDEPWLCAPRVVGMVTTASAGWAAGDVLFADGANYVGSTAKTERGWTVQIDRNTARVTTANGEGFIATKKTGGFDGVSKTDVKCKLVINY